MEKNEFARSIAQEAAKNLGSDRKVRSRSNVASIPDKRGAQEIPENVLREDFSEELIPLPKEDHDDKLPAGMTWEDIPKFAKIHGWQRDSKEIKKLRKNLSHSYKHDDNIVLEGKRLIIDAMRAGCYPSIFVFSRLNLLQGFPFDLSKSLAMYQVPYRDIKAWSDLSTSPGFIGEAAKFSYLKQI